MKPNNKLESEVQDEISIEGPHHNCFLMRNNSGACEDRTGRQIRYGLGNISKRHSDAIKSSDLIGITTITVTQEMVGKPLGIFTAIEVKNAKWRHPKNKYETAQQNFLQWVKSRGGFAGFANSVDMFKEILKR